MQGSTDGSSVVASSTIGSSKTLCEWKEERMFINVMHCREETRDTEENRYR